MQPVPEEDEINLTFNKTTWQASTKGDFVSSRAVDGIYGYGTGSSTAATYIPWWGVDLERLYLLHRLWILIFSTGKIRSMG